jgi:hypothetical protein
VDLVQGWGPDRRARGARTGSGGGGRHRKIRCRAAAGAALLALAGALTACGTAEGSPAPLPVPTFPPLVVATTAGPAESGDDGRLPDDCGRVLAGNDLGALFGLPLDSVVVRTTIGAPVPAVGRTERVACRYTRFGGDRADLLDVNISTYTDAEAAAKQWRTNADAEDGGHRDVQLGAARGVLVERPAEAVLMIANGTETLTFVLPEKIRIGSLSAADTLTDLALRVLPAVSGTGTPPPPIAPTASP